MLLELRNLNKLYGYGESRVTALDDINLDIEAGEFVAIMGPSGSGKSTLMNILGCLDRPTAGSYRLEGRNVSKLKDNSLADIRNRKIGFVFQTFNLLPRVTAVGNVELPMIYSGVPARRRRDMARMLLTEVGLGNRLLHRPNQMSGGQRQRVAIARALSNNPAVILADEPTGNLDSQSGNEIMGIFKRLNNEGATVILVTHDAEVAGYTRRIIRLKDGKIVADEQVRA
ncbi:MAG: ABC transporter ATP-binding protein [Bacillota bacterium]